MNIWSFLQLCVSGLFTGLSNALIVVGYVGIRNRKRDVRFAVIYGVLLMICYVACNLQVYIRVPFGLQMFLFLISYGMIFGGAFLYRPETGLTNIVGYWIGLSIYDAATVLEEICIEKVFHYTYNELEVIYSAKELSIKMGVELIRFLIGILVQYVAVKKLIPYKKLKSVSTPFKLFWMGWFLAYTVIGILYSRGLYAQGYNFTTLISLITIEIMLLVTGYYIFMFLYRRHQKRALSFLEEQMDGQKQMYRRVVGSYNELRDIRHDLYNYMQIVRLTDAGKPDEERMKGLKQQIQESNFTNYTDKIALNLMLNPLVFICREHGIVLEIKENVGELTERTELDVGFLLEQLVYNVVLLDSESSAQTDALKKAILSIVKSDSADGNVEICLSVDGVKLKGRCKNREIEKERRKNRQIIQMMIERYEGMQYSRKKEAHIFLSI